MQRWSSVRNLKDVLLLRIEPRLSLRPSRVYWGLLGLIMVGLLGWFYS